MKSGKVLLRRCTCKNCKVYVCVPTFSTYLLRHSGGSTQMQIFWVDHLLLWLVVDRNGFFWTIRWRRLISVYWSHFIRYVFYGSSMLSRSKNLFNETAVQPNSYKQHTNSCFTVIFWFPMLSSNALIVPKLHCSILNKWNFEYILLCK